MAIPDERTHRSSGARQLVIVADTSSDGGDLRGWALCIAAEVDTGAVSR